MSAISINPMFRIPSRKAISLFSRNVLRNTPAFSSSRHTKRRPCLFAINHLKSSTSNCRARRCAAVTLACALSRAIKSEGSISREATGATLTLRCSFGCTATRSRRRGRCRRSLPGTSLGRRASVSRQTCAVLSSQFHGVVIA